ncbi:MAG TPA: hypothetical protein VM008_17580 [Phycisphaerae bacterium]|nr:hypothetical protein [Phycisphaerae bacterium]
MGAFRRLRCVVLPLFLISLMANSASAMLNPTLGRFMQEDPLGYVDSPNMYLRTKGNPVIKLDLSGTNTVIAGVTVSPVLAQELEDMAERGDTAGISNLLQSLGADIDAANAAAQTMSNATQEAQEIEQTLEQSQQAAQDVRDATQKALKDLPRDIFEKLNNYVRSITGGTNCPGQLPPGLTPDQAQKYLDALKAAQALARNGATNPVVLQRIAELEKAIAAARAAGGP